MIEQGVSKRDALEAFVKTLKEKYGKKVEKIILFGSVARGDDREDSDIDILIITKEDSFEMQRLVSDIVVDILLKTRVYISAKVLSSSEFGLLRRTNSSFYRNISREGIIIG